jgi:hypothetical protein
MSRDQRTVAVLLVVGMVFGPYVGAAQASDKYSGVGGESTGDSHDQWIDLEEWPNPMERRTDNSAPAMRPGALVTPAEKAGTSAPAMQPGVTSQTGRASSAPGIPGATPGGPEVMDDGQHGRVLLKAGPEGMTR